MTQNAYLGTLKNALKFSGAVKPDESHIRP